MGDAGVGLLPLAQCGGMRTAASFRNEQTAEGRPSSGFKKVLKSATINDDDIFESNIACTLYLLKHIIFCRSLQISLRLWRFWGLS